MNDAQALTLLIKMKELGITDLEIEMTKRRFTPEPTIEVKAEDMVQPFNLDEMTEDEILYYATPYYDELQERKKLQKQKKDEEL